MIAAEFDQLATDLKISRAALIRQLGLATNTGNDYALGRRPIPRTVALACAALRAGLEPHGTPTEATAARPRK